MNKEAEIWSKIVDFFKNNFSCEEIPDLDVMIFLIGVQELGKGYKRFKKDEKVNLMHIAVCRLLEPFGYYAFTGRDAEGWPHFEKIQNLPALKPNEQTILMKKAIIYYFKEKSLLEE